LYDDASVIQAESRVPGEPFNALTSARLYLGAGYFFMHTNAAKSNDLGIRSASLQLQRKSHSDEVGEVACLHAFHGGLAVVLNSAWADFQHRRDFLVR
jgi:hypothetical protein